MTHEPRPLGALVEKAKWLEVLPGENLYVFTLTCDGGDLRRAAAGETDQDARELVQIPDGYEITDAARFPS